MAWETFNSKVQLFEMLEKFKLCNTRVIDKNGHSSPYIQVTPYSPRRPHILTGSSATIKINGKTVAFAKDVTYNVEPSN